MNGVDPMTKGEAKLTYNSTRSQLQPFITKHYNLTSMMDLVGQSSVSSIFNFKVFQLTVNIKRCMIWTEKMHGEYVDFYEKCSIISFDLSLNYLSGFVFN